MLFAAIGISCALATGMTDLGKCEAVPIVSNVSFEKCQEVAEAQRHETLDGVKLYNNVNCVPLGPIVLSR